jgi:hypothetical protein
MLSNKYLFLDKLTAARIIFEKLLYAVDELLNRKTWRGSKMKKYLYILIMLCFSCAVEAHEDPLGEIYPYVSVENDKFVVWYTVNKISETPHYRVVYDKNGNRIEAPAEIPRETYGLYKKRSLSTIDVVPTEKLSGFTLKDKEDYLVVYDRPRMRNVNEYKPYFLTKRNGNYIKEDIDWGKKHVYDIHDAMLIENEAILLVTERDITTLFLAEHFNVMSINRQTRKIEKYHSLGVPFRIWNFPVSTSLLYYNGRIFLAWGELYVDGLRLNLSSWKIGTDSDPWKESISGPINTNTDLSMAQIDGIVLVAYNYAKDGYHSSIIKTLTVDLRKHLR